MIAIISTGEAIAIGGNPDATNTNSLTFWHMFSYEFLAGQIDDTYPQPTHLRYNINYLDKRPSANANTSGENSGRRLVDL